MHFTDYATEERAQLLTIARSALSQAAATGTPYAVDIGSMPAALTQTRCSFVTLSQRGELRGCTGSLEPTLPLAADVAQVTWRTALSDPRFAPLRTEEVAHTQIEISVLSPLRALSVLDETDLIRQLQPGIDGLVLEAGPNRATFLPKVWDLLPEPANFVGQLKQKAGLAPDYWSEEVKLFRYHTETFAESSSYSRLSA